MRSDIQEKLKCICCMYIYADARHAGSRCPVMMNCCFAPTSMAELASLVWGGGKTLIVYTDTNSGAVQNEETGKISYSNIMPFHFEESLSLLPETKCVCVWGGGGGAGSSLPGPG